jgi:ATP-binding cassette, subfamily F, member 3
MIRLENIAVVFQGRSLFANVNWQITEGHRIGLVGVNGSGKSTLLKLITGLLEPDSGRIVRSKNFSVGYLPQELTSTSEQTVFDEALSGCGTARELELHLHATERAMSKVDPKSEEYEELVHEFGRLQHLFEEADGFALQSKTARVLQGLAVPAEWWEKPLKQLSGGWQMRIHLARLILSAPSLLLLDEPTNHLDVESIVWLSSFLRTYEGGLVMISHDRYFLDENVREIVEIENRKLHFYAGNFSFYLQDKENRSQLLLNAYENQKGEIARTERFIERFRYKATKARQVQSRIKQLEKLERVELPDSTDEIHLRLPEAPRSGRVVLEANGLGHSYGDKRVFSNLNFLLERGEKVALVGVNGAGKTTLLKILANVEKPLQGSVNFGHNVFPAYYAQIVAEQFDLRNTVLKEMLREDTPHDETFLRTVLGSFLFSGDAVYKKVSVLSGGEKSRLALAKILLRPSNLLLLDEPTNHLDMASKEILLEALQDYTGAILFIAHDRYFMDQLAQRVLELKEGILTSYPGNYSEYVLKISTSSEPAAAVEETVEVPAYHKSREQKKLEAEQRTKLARLKKEIMEPLATLEASISANEAELKQLESALADDRIYSDNRHQDYIQKYELLKRTLETEYKKWEALQKRKEEVEATQ